MHYTRCRLVTKAWSMLVLGPSNSGLSERGHDIDLLAPTLLTLNCLVHPLILHSQPSLHRRSWCSTFTLSLFFIKHPTFRAQCRQQALLRYAHPLFSSGKIEGTGR